MRLVPLLEKLSIIDKRGMQVPFKLNWAQLEYAQAFEDKWNSGRPVRIIVNKARQLGMSTVTEGIMFTLAMNMDNMRGMVLGNDIENAQHLLGMTDNYWETYPFRKLYTPKYNSRNELAWEETNSSIKVATAKNAKAGRGKTIRSLHASEIAFWDDARKTMLAISQAVPYLPETYICIESTANGVGGYYYDTWNAAEAGDVDYIPLFFPWHRHPEYTASWIGIPYTALGNLDAEERSLRSIGISDDRLAWRRWAIRNLCNNDINQFHQEYPTTPEEAFIATGTNVFPIHKLREAYQPMEGLKGRLVSDNGVRFQPDVSGPLTLYRKPSTDREHGVYMIGGDPTHTTRGDLACGQVINRRTMEQVAVLRQRIDPGNFGVQLDLLGQFYNNAMVAPEVEGPGYATVATLIERNYPHLWENKVADKTPGKHSDHFGWRTTSRSKELAIGHLLKVLVDGDTVIHDRTTFNEMRTYVTLENGGYGNADGSPNDDTVMAFAIAHIAHALEPPLMTYGVGDQAAEVPWETWGQMEKGD